MSPEVVLTRERKPFNNLKVKSNEHGNDDICEKLGWNGCRIQPNYKLCVNEGSRQI